MASQPLVFAFPEYAHLAPAADGHFETTRYANGEILMRVQTDVAGRSCAIIGSNAPPDKNILRILTLAHTLKKEGAPRVIAVLPYLGYARQDKNEPGKSWGAPLNGQLMAAAGIGEVFAVDIHSPAIAQLFPMPVRSVQPSDIWTKAVAELHRPNTTIVAPDEGAIARCQEVARAAGIDRDVAHIAKQHIDGVVHTTIAGETSANIVIVDDVLDTGGTLLSAAKHLYDTGATQITAVVSHGLFTGDLWQGIWNAGVNKLYCLDTTPQAQNMNHPKITVVPAAPLIEAVLGESAIAA